MSLVLLMVFAALAAHAAEPSTPPADAWTPPVITPEVRAQLDAAKAAFDAKNYEAAYDLYRLLADAGNGEALRYMAHLHSGLDGYDRPYDPAMVRYFEGESAATGYVDAFFAFAWTHQSPDDGREPNLEASACWFRAAAQLGEGRSQYALAEVLRRLNQENNASYWLGRAVDQGYGPALSLKYSDLWFDDSVIDKTDAMVFLLLASRQSAPAYGSFVSDLATDPEKRSKGDFEQAVKRADAWTFTPEHPPEFAPPPMCTY